jgi:LPS sulfotransferase NodH
MSVAWQGLARNKTFTADDAPILARMNATLALPNQSALARQMMHFALGKAYDDVGNYQEAIRNFEAGNQFRALAGKLNREELTALVDRLSDATPPGYRDRQPDGGSEDATPLLIVGLPRSGSTLIEQVISSHPEVAAGGELEFWVTRYPSAKGAWLPLAADAARRLADDYLAELRTKGPYAKRVTDKMLSNFWLLGLLHRLFPNATLIHCRRHPIDTALSIFTTNLAAQSARRLSGRGDLVFYIRQYQRLMAHWRVVLPSDRFVEVDYEALVADPEAQSRRLIAACGLAWNEACLTPHLNRRRIETASLWQRANPSTPVPWGGGGGTNHGSASFASWRRNLRRPPAVEGPQFPSRHIRSQKSFRPLSSARPLWSGFWHPQTRSRSLLPSVRLGLGLRL